MWAGKGGGRGGYYVTASASLMHTKGRFKYFFSTLHYEDFGFRSPQTCKSINSTATYLYKYFGLHNE